MVYGRYKKNYKTFYDGWRLMEGIKKTTRLSMMDGRYQKGQQNLHDGWMVDGRYHKDNTTFYGGWTDGR